MIVRVFYTRQKSLFLKFRILIGFLSYFSGRAFYSVEVGDFHFAVDNELAHTVTADRVSIEPD